MTTLKIKSALFERATEIAHRRNDSTNCVINRALELGLGKLWDEYQISSMPKNGSNGSKNGEGHTDGTARSSERFAWPSELNEEGRTFVRENAHLLNNQQIADALLVTFQVAKVAREAYASEFIRANWLQMTDGEMSLRLNLPSSSAKGISVIRQLIGLNRHKNAIRKVASLRSQLNPDELRKALTEDGQMLTEFAKDKGIVCSRERLRQMANELGVSTEASQRTVKWFASRWEVPHFGDKAVFEAELKETGSCFALAGKYGKVNLSVAKVMSLRSKHGTPLPNGFTPIPLVCDNPECGKIFHRDSFWVGKVQTNGKKAEHVFCCRKCYHAYRSGVERVVASL
ncbi:MAG: hypothetical protein Q7R64_02010 [bacterium]|nr:hypothetical protein [bacterium]